ncbi:MAG: hypothetical protein J6S67_05900 [Methanobrevibacter sp.]|nr:hypothetical protein [Methanobrevibacter sp.]
MSEVMINLKGTELGDKLNIDMISVESLITEFEDTINELDYYKRQVRDYEDPNNYDTTEGFMEVWKRHRERGH